MNKQWIDKYIPKSLNEMILSPDNINKISVKDTSNIKTIINNKKKPLREIKQ